MLLNALLFQAIAVSLVVAGDDSPRMNKRARRAFNDVDGATLDPAAISILAELATGTSAFPVEPTGSIQSFSVPPVPTAGTAVTARGLGPQLPGVPALPDVPALVSSSSSLLESAINDADLYR